MTKKMPRPMTTLPPHRVKVNTVPIGTGRSFPQDLPIAPGQEQFEDWFIFTLVTCRVVTVARFERWMQILRAYYHAEAWLNAPIPEDWKTDDEWRMAKNSAGNYIHASPVREAVWDNWCEEREKRAESWRRRAEELSR